MQVELTSIERVPRISKTTNKPFISVVIKTNTHGEQKLSGFANQGNAGWEVGDHVEITVEQKGQYLNFKNGEEHRNSMSTQPTSPASDARLTNMIEFKVLPELEQQKAGIAELKFLIQALGERLERFLSAAEKTEITTEDVPF